MSLCQLHALSTKILDGGRDVTAGATPSDDESVGICIAHDFKLGNDIGDIVNLGLTVANHLLVNLRIGRNGAVLILFETTQTVHKTLGARDGLETNERLGIASIRLVTACHIGSGNGGLDVGKVLRIGDAKR